MSIERSSVSVVITCFSEGELIFEALNSIKNQSMKPLEIIIVNDASKDQATIKVCQQLEQQPNVKLIWRSQNGGPSAARNNGFKAAIGEILVPLDADDLLPDKALETIQSIFDKYPKTDFLYGDYIKQRYPNDDQVINPGDIALSRMLKSNRFSPTSQWTLIGTAPLRKRSGRSPLAVSTAISQK
jgi:glycosyltransferase involved in cell wall biosynthesis